MNRYPDVNSVLVCDNAQIHQGPQVRQLCEAAGVRIIYLPPYCPELNPIELCFAAIKQKLRASQNLNNSVDTEWEIRSVAADIMNDKFCYKLYKHCGYCVPSN
jgi:transposase